MVTVTGTMARKSMEPFLKDSVKFYDHQVTGIREMMTMRNFLLADEMGLGKSLQAITVAIGDVFRWPDTINKIIVVAPVTLKGNWADELEKFTRLDYTILGQEPNPKRPGFLKALPPAARTIQLQQFAAQTGPRVLIANYEQIIKHVAEINKIGFHIAIFDEAHYLKNPSAKRTKACHQIRASRYFMLTGTPMLNRVDELWGILHLIDRNAYPKYYAFRNRYCVFGGWENKQITGIKNQKEINEALAKFQIRRYKKDVLDLPDIQFLDRKVHLSPKQQAMYDKVEEELEIEIAGCDTPSEIEHAMVKVMRLRQICGTLKPFSGEDVSSKLDLAVEDALELLEGGHKVVMFTQWRDVLEAYANRLDKIAPGFDIWEIHGGVPIPDRHALVNEWGNDGKPGVIACMLQVAGVGLNMTAARHLQLVDKLWTPGLNKQAIDRIHRIGQAATQPVQVLNYLCINTVETRVEQVLREKMMQIEQVVDDTAWQSNLLKLAMAKAGP